jgi:hypothetical protein
VSVLHLQLLNTPQRSAFGMLRSIKITEKHYAPWVKSRQDALDADLKGANGWLTDLELPANDDVRPITAEKA